MRAPLYERIREWVCGKLGHFLFGGWIYDGHFHQECKWCGRIISEPCDEIIGGGE